MTTRISGNDFRVISGTCASSAGYPTGISTNARSFAALHHAGFATLTHTPSPMGFLTEVLERPANERAFVLIPVGYPADDAQVPDIKRKSLPEILVVKEP